jgi:hypothetical protein
VEGGIPYRKEVCFGDHQNFVGIDDGIENLLEHLPSIFNIGNRDE